MASGLAAKVYHYLFRRTSTFTLTVIVAAVFFERGIDQIADGYFDRHNAGLEARPKKAMQSQEKGLLRRQWKDIKHKYEKPAEESS